MWYPNTAQWWVIWIVAILACFVFIASSESGLVDGMCLIGLGALLVWQLSRRKT